MGTSASARCCPAVDGYLDLPKTGSAAVPRSWARRSASAREQGRGPAARPEDVPPAQERRPADTPSPPGGVLPPPTPHEIYTAACRSSAARAGSPSCGCRERVGAVRTQHRPGREAQTKLPGQRSQTRAAKSTIVAYAQAIETAAAAAQERESIKNKDFINNSAHQQVSLQNTVVRLEGDVERLDAERLKMLERAVAAETERDLLKAHVRKIYDSRASNRAGPLQDPEAETPFAPALMPSSPVAAPAAEAASPKCRASEPPDGAGSPTYARLLERARHGYLEASVLMQEARHVEWFTNRRL